MREMELWRDKVLSNLHAGVNYSICPQIQLRIRDRIQNSASWLQVADEGL